CADCFGQPLFCTGCCRLAHQFYPLHPMEQWSGDHFTPSSRRAAGLVLYLGHSREKCP
ncbi:hypothetical protein BS17DRAFT_665103, partial [Gyrodon lividus]